MLHPDIRDEAYTPRFHPNYGLRRHSNALTRHTAALVSRRTRKWYSGNAFSHLSPAGALSEKRGYRTVFVNDLYIDFVNYSSAGASASTAAGFLGSILPYLEDAAASTFCSLGSAEVCGT